jgi:hypothetical protein
LLLLFGRLGDRVGRRRLHRLQRYVAPVFLRRRDPDFQPGPWNLGRWSPLVGWIGIAPVRVR